MKYLTFAIIVGAVILAAVAKAEPKEVELTPELMAEIKAFTYGPAEFAHDVFGVRIQSIHPDYYEQLKSPEITIHYLEEGLTETCGANIRWGGQGCIKITHDWSEADIYLSSRASPRAEAHELKHAYGWCHYEPDYDFFWSMTEEERQREFDRARGWYPCHNTPEGT